MNYVDKKDVYKGLNSIQKFKNDHLDWVISPMMKKEREKSIEEKKQTVLRQRRNSMVLVSIV